MEAAKALRRWARRAPKWEFYESKDGKVFITKHWIALYCLQPPRDKFTAQINKNSSSVSVCLSLSPFLSLSLSLLLLFVFSLHFLSNGNRTLKLSTLITKNALASSLISLSLYLPLCLSCLGLFVVLNYLLDSCYISTTAAVSQDSKQASKWVSERDRERGKANKRKLDTGRVDKGIPILKCEHRSRLSAPWCDNDTDKRWNVN